MNVTTAPSLRFLVVEDEALVAMMIEDLLQEFGCTVVRVVTTVAAALASLEAADLDIDAAILDVNLGGETAYPVAAALAARGVPFAFATGYGAAGVHPDFAGTPVLVKPFADEALREIVARLTRR